MHIPGAGEFLHEFIGHFLALEGKLWTTLKMLVLRPGLLTAEFLRGRRVPFIEPLRLYLTMSVVFFALVKICGIVLPQLTFEERVLGAKYSKTVPSRIKAHESDVLTVFVAMRPEKGQTVESANKEFHDKFYGPLEWINPRWSTNLQQFMKEPDAKKAEMLNSGFLGYLPSILIGTLPLFALYLKLIYFGSRRRYGEHLVFALHANSFAFLIAALMIAIPGTAAWVYLAASSGEYALASPWDWLQVLPTLTLFAYLPIAMQRVYGGRKLATLVRWIFLISLHLAVIACATVAAEMIAIIGH
ncbi:MULTISPECIES: DUF3667 domain-containing protein [unclassified Duganella]|uniref:DUF3667 domain-containing protein n=1 Tax=unclassified Duganella TaxID=2636909 RepID=UPI000E34CA5E|nr:MULTISPECIES: DUF3667 domain-containing protein [unclassified Duganella]RFP19371.1 DUF3667 domain-containing protein [Duganella sp. BJB475]RFP35952.1 DUF3667 domain-containing protein [Duganella sp. BJB476]